MKSLSTGDQPVPEGGREGERVREREYACGLEDGGTHIDSQLAVSLSTADEVVLPVLECTPYCEEWEWLMGGAYIHTDACMHA